MRFTICIFLIQYIILWIQFDFSNSKPVVGKNIRTATENEFTFIVAIVRSNNNFQPERDLVCAGTLISSEDVLTCEHCFKDVSVDNSFQVIAGSVNLLNGIKYHMFWWITYDQWAIKTNKLIEYPQNDVAIIRLLSMVVNTITPARMSTTPTTHLYGLNAIIAGWGLCNNNTVVNILQVGDIKIITKDECEIRIGKIMNQIVNLDDRFLCSLAKPYVLLSHGDSGGPLIHEGTIIAINKGTSPFRQGAFNPNEVNAHIGIEYYGKFILHVQFSTRF